MAETKIEWAKYTFNPWRGCTKVSDGCTNCYAETMSGRNPKTLGVWGKYGTRIVASESMWKQPLKWDRWAKEGRCPECQGRGFFKDPKAFTNILCKNCDNGRVEPYRSRVFCASLADVFEGRDTMPDSAWEAVDDARIRLFELIEETPNLDWLLLTKRPENVLNWLTPDCGSLPEERGYAGKVNLPDNVWIGTSVEDQKTADERIPHLLQIPAKVRFLSVEPLLGPIDFRETFDDGSYKNLLDGQYYGLKCKGVNGHPDFEMHTVEPKFPRIDWVIVGGESGTKARPMHPDWVRSIRDQCQAADVPFFFKQWGEWFPMTQEDETGQWTKLFRSESLSDSIIGTAWEIPATREHGPAGSAHGTVKIGKKKAGRLLDGREWNEFPEVAG